MIDYGISGLILILAGWIYETYHAIKNRKTSLPLAFALLYGFGSLLLTVHSWILNDTVFIILNAVATVIAVINIFLILTGKKN